MIRSRGLNHIKINVSNLKRSLAFYQKAFGLKMRFTAGRHMVRMGDDGWAIFSQDGSLAAHFEFTIAVTADGPRILTPWHEEDRREGAGGTG